jgi:hypothetical protein
MPDIAHKKAPKAHTCAHAWSKFADDAAMILIVASVSRRSDK